MGDLLDTTAAVLRQEPDGSQTVLGTVLGIPEDLEEATRKERSEAGYEAIDTVTRTRRAAHVGHAVGAPIVVDDRLWGFVVAASPLEMLPVGTESRLADFTELVAAAIANADSRDQLTASRARVVAASDASRRRIERDLHDGVQQRLVALQLDLRLAETLVTDRSSNSPNSWCMSARASTTPSRTCSRWPGASTRPSSPKAAWGPPCAPWPAAPPSPSSST